jgi:hypothetical protein
MIDSQDWYISRDGKPHGPVTFAQLSEFHRQGQLRSGDFVWHPKRNEWLTPESLFPKPAFLSHDDGDSSRISPNISSQPNRKQAEAPNPAVFRISKTVISLAVAGVGLIAAIVALLDSSTIKALLSNDEPKMIQAAETFLRDKGTGCWGAKRFANASQYETAKDNFLVFTRSNIGGSFLGDLMRERDQDLSTIQQLIAAGAIDKNIEREERRVNFTTAQEIWKLRPVKRNYWYDGKGFCFGTPTVVRVLGKTAPAPNSRGQQIIRIDIEWKHDKKPDYIANWHEKERDDHRATITLEATAEGFRAIDYTDTSSRG